jgi:hypothetical protein
LNPGCPPGPDLNRGRRRRWPQTGRRAVSFFDLLGRERELEIVENLLTDSAGSPRVVVIDGEAGIGKSTLWTAGVELARARAYTVLVARGSEAEVGLSFAGLTDLLDPVIDTVRDRLPEPQRIAVEVALLRRAPAGTSIGPREIGAAELDKGGQAGAGATLTRAEQQVADLVATGLTNREAATRLFASVRTVEGHLAAVYRKLAFDPAANWRPGWPAEPATDASAQPMASSWALTRSAACSRPCCS